MCPQWSERYGLDADPLHQLRIDQELAAAGIRRPVNTIGTGIGGPTILHAGTPEQIEKYVPKILTVEEIWCQLFSEPGAGSDFAWLTTTARRDGQHYVVNGSEGMDFARAHREVWGPTRPYRSRCESPQKGISYLLCPMDLDGITVRPLVEMTGAHTFNEVFF